MEENLGWIGVDLDGTLAEYSSWRGRQHIGAPVPRMVARVKTWLAEGRDVRIFTARVGPQADAASCARAQVAIRAWCIEHLGRALPITATKDFTMAEFWDDRCVQVWSNTGRRADGFDEVEAGRAEAVREVFAKLLDGPLPASRQHFQQALITAAILGRKMDDGDPSLVEVSERYRKPWLRIPGLPGILTKKRRPIQVGGGSRNPLGVQ